jgi:23S rRNA (guanine2445-N2)-methyltransferase / 23S rRNA (guanine2069-N7)-methyltransferase
MDFVAPCARGLEAIVEQELRALGADPVEPGRMHVRFAGALELAYRACLWSRTASRVLMVLGGFDAGDEKALYDGVRTIDWSEHLTVDGTLAVDFTTVGSFLDHTQFGSRKVKDAIVDQFRDATGRRPSVDPARPDVRVRVHVENNRAEISLDLAGESLHKRGWRMAGGEAPLKENLAAGLLLLADWPALAAKGAPFVDPMCGSGTLLVEAALIAAGRAPGERRDYWGFLGWRGHDADLWKRLHDEARAAAHEPTAQLYGFDADSRAVALARRNLASAGFSPTLEARPLAELTAPPSPGLLMVNPPYGERLGDEAELGPLYAQLGDVLKRRFAGWQAYVLTGSAELAKQIGLRAARRHEVYNGAIECRLLAFPISEKPPTVDEPAWRKPRRTEGGEMFANRLQKNLKHLKKWAKREGVSCFRVYDADLPEYAVAVDLYEDAACVAEYAPPSTVDPRAAEARLNDVRALVPEVLGVAPESLFVKLRRRQRPEEQYGRQAEAGAVRVVHEGGHRFEVNLSDFLDTGLFLDQRRLRAIVGERAAGRRFLNLFAYTATATVYAADAAKSVSVDLSNTYLDWAGRNFRLNGLDEKRHRLERADVLAWLPTRSERYDLILVAPPTFSNSKSMRDTFDVQRDHAALLTGAAALLSPDGELWFVTHARRFKLEPALRERFSVEEWTAKTVPEDFGRDPRTHSVWRFTVRPSSSARSR